MNGRPATPSEKAAFDKATQGPSLELECLSDIERKSVRWLWPERIARGKLSMVAGHPGLGKSQLAINLAAIVSTGRPWPDGTQTNAGDVLLLSAEDDAGDTIRPRLEAAGADLDRVHIIASVRDGYRSDGTPARRAFHLNQDEQLLKAAVDTLSSISLLIIDPISAYFGGDADTHNNAEVRAALTPIASLAAEKAFAVLCVSHLNKGGGTDALLRVTGSLAFVAAARAAYLVAKDPQDEDRRLFLPLKNNLSRDATGLAFTIEGHTLEANGFERVATSRLVWSSEPVTTTANELMGQAAQDPDERTALDDAKGFLKGLLMENGPMPAKKVYAEGRDAGHADRTIRRAQQALGVDARKEGGAAGKWMWYLPNREPGQEG